METIKNGYAISTDKSKLQVDIVHNFLKNTYWAKDIPLQKIESAIEHSLCFGVYYDNFQIGFARVISDFSGFAYIADVFILPEHRKKGLSKWLISIILSYPELQNMRRWMLATKDAHSLYEKFGFTALKNPKQFMELHDAKKNPY